MSISDRLRSMVFSTSRGWEPSSDDAAAVAAFSMWGQAWLESGFPQIDLGHKLAASFACTSAPSEALQVQFLPWRSFLMLVPTGLCPHPLGGELAALWVVPGDPAGNQQTGGWHAETLFSEHHSAADVDAFNAKHLEMYRRLVIGAVIELQAPKHRDRIVLEQSSKAHHKRRTSELPTAWTFRLSRDVKIDLRSEVRAYCLGTVGTSPTIQVLVRGHYKRQPYGPGLTERKWIHIEPYWRGPEDAPIGVRSHVLSEQPDLDAAEYLE